MAILHHINQMEYSEVLARLEKVIGKKQAKNLIYQYVPILVKDKSTDANKVMCLINNNDFKFKPIKLHLQEEEYQH